MSRGDEPLSAMKKKPQRQHPRKSARRGAARVTGTSDAIGQERSSFLSNDPRRIVRSLKRSSGHGHRRTANPYGSAASMLFFYPNREGRNLGPARKLTLEEVKAELKKLFGRSGWERRTKKKDQRPGTKD